MTVQSAAYAAYIVAALLFILALAGLSKHDSARTGNTSWTRGWAPSVSRSWRLPWRSAR